MITYSLVAALPETEYRRREGERIQKRALLLDALLAKDNLGPVDERPLINMGAPADQALSSPTLRISFRSSSCSSETWSAHIAVDQPLTRVLPDLCSAFGLATDATPRLFFDGTLLDPSKSPQQLQLEDDDLIDVCLAKK